MKHYLEWNPGKPLYLPEVKDGVPTGAYTIRTSSKRAVI
jgi:hypothetical protein